MSLQCALNPGLQGRQREGNSTKIVVLPCAVHAPESLHGLDNEEQKSHVLQVLDGIFMLWIGAGGGGTHLQVRDSPVTARDSDAHAEGSQHRRQLLQGLQATNFRDFNVLGMQGIRGYCQRRSGLHATNFGALKI